MEPEFVTDAQQFFLLRDEWNRLADGSPLNSWEWNAAWWDAFGEQNQLAIVAIRHEGQIRGIAPWCISATALGGRTLRFIGSGKACTDYQRILAEPQHLSEVVACLGKFLTESSKEAADVSSLDCVELDGVTSEEPSIQQLLQLLTDQGFETNSREIDSSWVVPLPANWSDFEKQLPKQLRRKVRKAEVRASSPDIWIHRTRTIADLDAIWPTFVRLHQQRFQNRADDPGCFIDSRFEKFLAQATRHLLQRGQAEIHWVQQGDTPFAAQLYLFGRNTAFMYQSGFDPAFAALEPGHLLYTAAFRQFMERQITSVDFLRGNEPYKAMWGAQPVPLFRHRCVPPRLLPRLRQEALNVGRTLKQLAGNYF